MYSLGVRPRGDLSAYRTLRTPSSGPEACHAVVTRKVASPAPVLGGKIRPDRRRMERFDLHCITAAQECGTSHKTRGNEGLGATVPAAQRMKGDIYH